ncbi:MAG TPA: hypothetical protein VGS99_03745 [Gammaproteobacteria bacterium]|nr:hypothetical protein [Gammaproteobacteria bacterium]
MTEAELNEIERWLNEDADVGYITKRAADWMEALIAEVRRLRAEIDLFSASLKKETGDRIRADCARLKADVDSMRK